MAEIWLALGSNLGARRQHLRAALAGLAARGVRLRRVSSLYETEPMYDLNQPAFLNAVLLADTQLAPEALLSAAKAVEADLGRRRRRRYGPREIDVDILLYEGQQRDTPELTIPHPRMAERPFVQAPLAELRGEPPAEWPGVAIVEDAGWASG